MGWWKKRATKKEERNSACTREQALLEKLESAQRETYRAQHRLATVTEVAGEMASKRLVIERDLALVRGQLKTAMSLLETVRSVPELVLEIVNEGRAEPVVYDRAEKAGISREVESVQQVHAILLAMKSSRVVADARERVLLERIHHLEDVSGEVRECVDMLGSGEEDTRKVRIDSFEET